MSTGTTVLGEEPAKMDLALHQKVIFHNQVVFISEMARGSAGTVQ